METKVKSKVKNIVKGSNVTKETKVLSKYTLQLKAHKENKAEMFGLFKVLRNIDPTKQANKDFFTACKFDPVNLTPDFILKNCTLIKVKGLARYENIKGEIYFSAKVKGQPTKVKKSLWSLWDIEQTIRFASEK